jgi:RNA polymerase sigma-70 factor (ECF subfamily)
MNSITDARGREVQDSDGISDRQARFTRPNASRPQGFSRRSNNSRIREAIVLIGASGFSYGSCRDLRLRRRNDQSRVSRARTRLQEILKISGEDDSS